MANGLTLEEVRHRLSIHGSNVLAREKRRPTVLKLADQLTHFFALLLWAAAALALLSEHLAPGQGMATLGWTIVAVILVNAAFSFFQEYRAERALESLASLLPSRVSVFRSGTWHETAGSMIVPGDLLAIEEGDSVAADCRIIEAYGLRVSNASLTGESAPESRDSEPSSEDHPLRATNAVLAGTSIVAGRGVGVVYATGMRTEFGRIARLTRETREIEAPLQREIRRLSYLITALSLGLAILFFVVGQRAGLTLWQNALLAIGVLVANVPEGLLPEVTLSLAIASQRMAKRRALVRHLPAVQALGSATVICTDKTGTLTENRMRVSRVLAGEAALGGPPIAEGAAFRKLCEVAFFCNDLKTVERGGHREVTGDPMEVALYRMARPFVQEEKTFHRAGEIPFDGKRRRLTTQFQTPAGTVVLTKGAPEAILPLCTRLQVANGPRPLSADDRQALFTSIQSIAEDGLRVLAFAFRPDDSENWESDLILLGLAGLEDPPRPLVHEAVKRCHSAGIQVLMLTGDHPLTAAAIARQIGLASSRFVTGDELERISDSELERMLRHPDLHFARLASDQKLRIVRALRANGHVVAVTGDGVNDAPALKEADVGVAMGLSGADVARQAADLILLDDHFATIVDAIEEGRTVFLNVRKFVTYVLTSNVPELIPYLAFALAGVPLALTVPQILLVDLCTDVLPALGLGAEPAREEVLSLPPSEFRGRLVDVSLMAVAYGFLGLLEATISMTIFLFSLHWHWPQRVAMTACLFSIIVLQMVNVLACRSQYETALRSFWSNGLIVTGLVTEALVIALVGYTPLGSSLFATEPVPAQLWGPILIGAVLFIALDEARKAVIRSRAARSAHGRNVAQHPAEGN